MNLSKLAGLPNAITKRAEEILTALENSEPVKAAPVPKKSSPVQSLFVSQGLKELLKFDVPNLTPFKALNILYKLQEQAKAEIG